MILLVDDEPDLRNMLREILAKANYKCSEAGNTREALKEFSKGGFKGVVLDIGMPGSNGIQLAKELKKKDPTVKIICLSAYAVMLEEDIAEAKIDFVMDKPFKEDAFIKIVGKAFVY